MEHRLAPRIKQVNNYDYENISQECQTGAMALKIAPINVFERQRPFYGRHVPAK